MVSLFRFFLVSLVFTLGMTTGGHTASFDCSKAATETEIAICDNPVLSMLDEDLSFIYSALLQIYGDTDRLINDQREWVKSRDNAGTDFVDLFSKISSRMEFLSRYFNFQKCLPHFHRLKLDTCFKVFEKIALMPIPVELLRIGDGLSIEVKFNDIKYSGSYSKNSLPSIYDWEENKTVFYMWSPDPGLFIFNPLAMETTKVSNMISYQRDRPNIDMPHPITNVRQEYCDGYATDTGEQTATFCKLSALDLWKLELDRKLRNIEGKDDIKKSLSHVLSVIPYYWGQLELIEGFVKHLPDQ